MEDTLREIWNVLGIPAVWGSILTIIVIATGIVLKKLIDHSFESQLEKLKELQTQDAFIRDLYAENLKRYSSEQAQSLRQAYLLLFEPHSSTVSAERKDHDEQLKMAIQMIRQPLREYAGGLDESTIKKINSVGNYLEEFKGRPEKLKNEKVSIYDKTEVARQFVKVDKIAFRLGLISRPLEERRPTENDK